jgi:Putative zinc-finger
MEISVHTCHDQVRATQVAAYLDGQLEGSAISDFESHVAGCQPCRAELTAQRQFLCELDSALNTTEEISIPKDFARIVSARAESDMRGVRDGGERRRALVVCLVLGITAFGLLGATNGKSLLLSGRLLANKVLGILGLLWTTLHDAFVGLTLVIRVVARVFQPQSSVMSLAALILLALAIASLSQLIIRYHRRGQMRLFE